MAAQGRRAHPGSPVEVPRSSLLDALNGLVTRPDDPVQQALDRYLLGSFPPVDQLDAAGLSGALQLGRWVGSQPGLPDPAEVQARLDMVTLLDPLRRLLARGFVGPQDLLDELESFIRAENPQRPDVFLIEGIGGSGKSTVLARTVLDLPTRDDLAVYLSFDRGWLIDGGSWAVFDEIVRQVGVGLPARRQAALELRQRAQQQSQRAGGYAEIASRSLQRRDPVGVDLLEELAKLTADHSRLMVVLDTLEELARRDVSYGEELFSFMSALTRSVRQVRVVAAGRSAPAVTSASTRLSAADRAGRSRCAGPAAGSYDRRPGQRSVAAGDRPAARRKPAQPAPRGGCAEPYRQGSDPVHRRGRGQCAGA